MKQYLYILLLTVNVQAIGQTIRVSDGSPLTLQSRLHLTGTANQSGLRLSSLPYSATATVLNRTKFLTVDDEGNVILGSINSGGRQGADLTGLWQSVGVHVQNSNPGGVIIGEGIINKPEGYNLYVSRGIITERLKVAIKTTDDWSDKVFSPAYKLRSLPEVKRYVEQHHHLPGIDSAEQVVKQGVDVGMMQAKLLEKIEEITIYLFKLQDEVTRLRLENEQMKQQLKRGQADCR